MILGFKQFFDTKRTDPTYFREKILCGIPNVGTLYPHVHNVIARQMLKPKIHTLREDKHDRWKAGMSIQMVYRGKYYSIEDHFNMGFPELEKCVSIQRAHIVITDKAITYKSDNTKEYSYSGKVQIDMKKVLSQEEVRRLALNDGFQSSEDFFNYFRKGFDGRIIHWTDLRY